MGLPFTLNVTLYAGATFDITFDWTNVDLTGCTARLQIRDKAGALLVDLATGSGITIGVTTSGGVPTSHVSATATPAQTALLRAARFADYDLLITYPSARVDPLLRGVVAVVPSVTQ